MTTKDQAIAPCPFCGAGETLIKENGKMWTGMKFSEPASVSIQHWCAPVDGQPNRMVERVGRDMGSAISAWNSRAAQPPPPGQEQPAQPDHSELVKDAARYRWLREQHWSDSKFAVVSNPKTAVNLGSICPSRELLDEAIDAAIGETME